jgi:D-3-phosphoglycerate dehydrogenase / 2-oxoglutarate reductase
MISVPDDFPPVLRSSSAFAELDAPLYFDSLPGSEDVLISRIRDSGIVLNIRSSSKFTARVFEVWGAGTDHVDLEAAARHGVTVRTTPGVSAISIAEHALALTLAAARRIPVLDSATRSGTWPRGESVQLYGKTCGIIGLGAIGRQFLRLANGFGMRTIAWTLHPRPDDPLVELDELYRTSDVISLHLRLSDKTAGMIGAREFALMKPGAIFVNTARGAIADEAALVAALRAGRIAAGLDVFTVEPLPAEHPLLGLANAVITPHCAGITPEALDAGLRMAVENCHLGH